MCVCVGPYAKEKYAEAIVSRNCMSPYLCCSFHHNRSQILQNLSYSLSLSLLFFLKLISNIFSSRDLLEKKALENSSTHIPHILTELHEKCPTDIHKIHSKCDYMITEFIYYLQSHWFVITIYNTHALHSSSSSTHGFVFGKLHFWICHPWENVLRFFFILSIFRILIQFRSNSFVCLLICIV